MVESLEGRGHFELGAERVAAGREDCGWRDGETESEKRRDAGLGPQGTQGVRTGRSQRWNGDGDEQGKDSRLRRKMNAVGIDCGGPLRERTGEWGCLGVSHWTFWEKIS